MIYLDASVLAALLFEEPSGVKLAASLKQSGLPLTFSTLTSAEVSSAVARRNRMNLDTEDQARELLDALDRAKQAWGPPVMLDDRDVWDAERLVRIFPLGLRAPDAIHATVCLRHGFTMATLDRGLARACDRLEIATFDAVSAD